MRTVDRVKEIFGSQRAVAEALGIGESAVSMWRTKGIPAGQKWRLLELARERRLSLEPEDLGLAPRVSVGVRAGAGHA